MICLFLLGIVVNICLDGENGGDAFPGFTLTYRDQNGENPIDCWNIDNDILNQIVWEDNLVSTYTAYKQKPAYSMHANGLSPWIFHPSCFIWVPGIFAMPLFLLGFYLFGGVRGKT